MSDETMKSLVSAAVAEQMTPEIIMPKIQTAVEKMIDSIIKDSLRTYSDNGRIIEKAVADSLAIGSLDLPAYGTTVCEILKTQIDKNVSTLVSGQLTQDMEKLLQLAPKEIKLSEIVKDMLESHYEYEDGYEKKLVTCIVDGRSSNLTFIYLDDDDAYEDFDKHLCQYSFHVTEDGKIKGGNTSDRIHGASRDLSRSKDFGNRGDLGSKIRSYWACGTTIIVDEYDVSTSRDYD